MVGINALIAFTRVQLELQDFHALLEECDIPLTTSDLPVMSF